MHQPSPIDFYTSGDQTQTSESNVEYKQRIHGDEDAILDDARSTEDADARSQRPQNQDNVDGNPDNDREVQRAE